MNNWNSIRGRIFAAALLGAPAFAASNFVQHNLSRTWMALRITPIRICSDHGEYRPRQRAGFGCRIRRMAWPRSTTPWG